MGVCGARMIVKEMIEKLQKMPQELPIFYVMFDDGYNVTELSDGDVVQTTLEANDGKEFPAIVFGEGWLL